jgi:hypothetical protein
MNRASVRVPALAGLGGTVDTPGAPPQPRERGTLKGAWPRLTSIWTWKLPMNRVPALRRGQASRRYGRRSSPIFSKGTCLNPGSR